MLSGSIIEALLVDYLIVTNYQQISGKDPLEMSFNDLIIICAQKGILSKKTEQISHAIRSYRNLIHPGRIKRLNETADKDGAIVASALVNMVIKEIMARKQEKYGYTAEQIVTKIESDPYASAILSHLLKEISEFERERLLLEIIPQQYIYFLYSDEGRVLSSLSECFRQIYEITSDDVKRKVAKALVKVVKEESESVAYAYEVSFFRATDFQYFSDDDKDLVKQHLLSILIKKVSSSLINALKGIGMYLTTEDEILAFINPLIKAYIVGIYDAKEAELLNFLRLEYSALYDNKGNYMYFFRLVKDIFHRYIGLYSSDQAAVDKLKYLEHYVTEPYFDDLLE